MKGIRKKSFYDFPIYSKNLFASTNIHKTGSNFSHHGLKSLLKKNNGLVTLKQQHHFFTFLKKNFYLMVEI